MFTSSRGKFFCLAAGLVWALALPLGAEQPPRAELITAHRIGTTPPMANYLATHHPAPNAPLRVFPLRKPSSHPGKGNGGGNGGGSTWTDKDLQTSALAGSNVHSLGGFEGISADGYVPPDTNISVGNQQVVETVNVNYAVFSESGAVLQTPTPIHAIFAAAGAGLSNNDICTSVDGGDPIVLYDRIDQRWIISQLAYNISFSNNHLCLAISSGPDAVTSSYTAYDISFGKLLPDYPKLAIWTAGTTWNNTSPQAGVYFSANMFSHNSFVGARMCGFPLSDVANPPSKITWVCAPDNTSAASLLPADLEGSPLAPGGTTSPAPAGAAEYYLQFTGSSTLSLYQFAPDFTNGTYTVTGPTNLSVNPFHEACGGGACVPQANTSTQLDSLGDRLMYRLSYRNYGSGGQSMVVTQSVQNSSINSQTGVRWYQLTNTAGTWQVGQQGTYGLNDGNYRWMGSIAQDKAGDLGLGYSVSSPTAFPSIAFTGQVPGEASGKMEGEQTSRIGTGAQTSVNRWGDYSSMSVDPHDDCTFWYANEYLSTTGSYTNWGTYINKFKVYASGSACQ